MFRQSHQEHADAVEEQPVDVNLEIFDMMKYCEDIVSVLDTF